MADRLAPVARFLLLFALFTVVGTTILTRGPWQKPPNDSVEPATAAAQHSLESQTLQTPTNGIEPPAATPTAAGPLGSKTPRTGLRTKANPSASGNPQSAIDDRPSTSRTANAKVGSSPRSENQQSDVTAGGSASPPALARLSGYILEAPTRQAHHDEHEPSLH
ncbi:MAG: hypothetical protein WD738_05995 [Pirellulales bacterium]